MKFLILTVLVGTLFFLDVHLNLFEKIFFVGLYFLCFAMEIGSIIIEIKNPSKEKQTKSFFFLLRRKIRNKKTEKN